jgi:glycosyltransferase involved in cell wall biosynthesis
VEGRLISIVVPVYNEEESVGTLLQEIRDMAAREGLTVQVLFVDDGSRDNSWSRICELAAADPAVAGIRFRRNAGKAAALMAGFAAVQGDLVVMMDADLQDPPEEVPQLIARLDEGYDLVSGWKRRRHDPWHKVYPSHLFNRVISLLTGVHLHDHVCGLKCMRRAVAEEVRIHGESHRFIGVLAAAKGFRVTEIPTLHRARRFGVSKYGFTRFAKGFLDVITLIALTRFRWRPQHLIGVTGILTSLVGALISGLWLVDIFLSSALMMLLLALWMGLVLVAVGLAAEFFVASTPPQEQYIVSERVGWCGPSASGGTGG